MNTEIEAKFPDIDSELLRLKLKELGAVKKHGEILMRRKNFDYKDRKLEKKHGWIRVRDEGDKITLSYKQLDNRTLHGMKEINVTINDFDKTCELLISIGLEVKAYQESKREKWKYNDVEITIDTWPWVPTFVELEGMTEKSVRQTAQQLGLDWKKAMYGSVEPIYQMHYDATESEINNWKSITFSPVPDWLLEKKKVR
jgi:adenylate cyclase class 2